MSSEKEHSPQHEELLKKQALEQQEVKEVLVFIRKYSKPAAIAIGVICALVLVNRFFKSQHLQKEAKADTALMQAASAEELQDIYDKYASTPAGPLALMNLARTRFNEGAVSDAEAYYKTFLKKYSKHSMAPQAELNLIQCKEAQGLLAEAHMAYGEYAEKQKNAEYLQPVALMGKARCLEALEEYDEAQIVYEDVIVNYPESSWARQAEANLQLLATKK